jgi:hypothetical protein
MARAARFSDAPATRLQSPESLDISQHAAAKSWGFRRKQRCKTPTVMLSGRKINRFRQTAVNIGRAWASSHLGSDVSRK